MYNNIKIGHAILGSPTCESDNLAGGLEVPRLCTSKVNYRVHKNHLNQSIASYPIYIPFNNLSFEHVFQVARMFFD